MIERRTELKRTTGLAPGSPLARKTPLKAARRDTGPARATRALVMRRDGYACVACGRSIHCGPYSLQHRDARGMGGTSDPSINLPSNLIVLCGSATTPGSCHLRAESRDPESNARGYWLRNGEDPGLTPVKVWWATDPLLPGDDGTYRDEDGDVITAREAAA